MLLGLPCGSSPGSHQPRLRTLSLQEGLDLGGCSLQSSFTFSESRGMAAPSLGPHVYCPEAAENGQPEHRRCDLVGFSWPAG